MVWPCAPITHKPECATLDQPEQVAGHKLQEVALLPLAVRVQHALHWLAQACLHVAPPLHTAWHSKAPRDEENGQGQASSRGQGGDK